MDKQKKASGCWKRGIGETNSALPPNESGGMNAEKDRGGVNKENIEREDEGTTKFTRATRGAEVPEAPLIEAVGRTPRNGEKTAARLVDSQSSSDPIPVARG